jgi:hypothetical protein
VPEEEPLLKKLARLCSLDIGKEVLPGDVYGIMQFGDDYDKDLTRFTQEERNDIMATIIKEANLSA